MSDRSSSGPLQWTRRDTLVLIPILAFVVVTRVLFHTRFAYSWDTANFVLATRQLELRYDLPHGAGYIFWVCLGRLGGALGMDVHTAFIAWNLVASLVGTALIYWLGMAMWDRRTGLGAALLFATSPVTWFYAGTAYADVWDATLGMAVASLAWRQRRQPSLAVAALATAVYALAAGIRQQNLVFLFPLWVWAVWPLRWPGRAAMALLAAVASLSWAVPLTRAAGGLGGYLELLRIHSQRGFEGYSWSSWHDFLATGGALVYIFVGLMLGCFLFCLALPFYLDQNRARRPWRSWWQEPRALFLVLWIAPATLFLMVVHLIVRPGLTLVILPPVILATAAACTQVVIPPGKFLHEQPAQKLLGMGIILNLIFFLALELPVSRLEMQSHDRLLGNEYRAIRERFNPLSSLLISHENWFWYSARQAALHLPEYEVWYMDEPTPRRWWAMHGGRTRTLTDLHIPERIRNVVFIHAHQRHERGYLDIEVDHDLVRREPLPGGGWLCWMPLPPGEWHDLLYTRAWHGQHPKGEPVRPRPTP